MQNSEIKGVQVEKEVECPMCNSFFTIRYFRAGNRAPSIRYSDGQTDVTSILNPMPTTHCVFCAFSFTVHLNTHKISEKECMIHPNTLEEQKMPEPPGGILEGYLNSVRFRSAIVPPEEFFLRKHIWWFLNNEKEASGVLFQQYEKVWEENLKEILKIIDYISLDEPFIKAEAFRNLGLFDQCLEVLENLPADADPIFTDRLKKECENGNPYRVVL